MAPNLDKIRSLLSRATLALWLGFAAFLFLTTPVSAAEIVSQLLHNQNSAQSLTSSGNNIWVGQMETTGYSATGYVDTFTTDTSTLTSVSFLLYNAGGSTCTATQNFSAGGFYYCAIGTDCTGGDRTLGNFTGGDNINVPAGGFQWIEVTVPAVAANRVWYMGGLPITAPSNCGSTYARIYTSDILPDSKAFNETATYEAAFRMCTGGTDCGSDATTADVIYPEAATTYPILNGTPWRFGTNVCESDVPDQIPNFSIEIEKDNSGWAAYSAYELDTPQLLVDPDNRCPTGLAYGLGAITNPTLNLTEQGDYRIRVSVDFGSGWSNPSSWTEFAVGGSNTYVGNGAVWGGVGDGEWGETDWQTYFDSVDDHDTAYGACDFWGSTADDGLPCLWSWIRYALIPPADGAFFYVSQPMETLVSRWPLSYISTFIINFRSGLTGTGTCPFPTFFGEDFFDTAVPAVDVCDWLDPLPTFFDDHPSTTNILQTIIWLGVVIFSVDVVRRFFSE